MKFRNQIEYIAVASLLGLCRVLPESMVYGIFRGLGALSHRILASRRRLALKNTEIAFPEKTLEERKRIVRQHFLNLAESMALNTLIMSGRISNERILGMVEIDDWKLTERVISQAPKGVLIISGHIGNWEMLSQYTALRLKDRQLHVIARESNNELLERKIVLPLRKRFGVSVFYKKSAMLKIMQAARKGDISGFLIDQKLNLKQGIEVDFFDRKAGATPAPAIMQIRFGLVILPMFMIRTAPRTYQLICLEPVEWQDNGKPMEEQIRELTSLHQGTIESMIRKYPDQWFWVHNRWSLKKGER